MYKNLRPFCYPEINQHKRFNLAFQPELIIADEPTSALDATLQARTIQLLRNLSIHEETAILFITHDLNAAATLCDRLIIMYGGLPLRS